jgi:hypothetical protein
MTGDIVDVKAALTESLTELHLPTVRRIYEEAARLAERETLSYERYLLDLVTRESQDRQQKRGCKTFCVNGVFRKDKENARWQRRVSWMQLWMSW